MTDAEAETPIFWQPAVKNWCEELISKDPKVVKDSGQEERGTTGDDKSEHQHFRNQWINIDWRGKFNSDNHYIYYFGQNPLEEME